jgi:hypothetical protein
VRRIVSEDSTSAENVKRNQTPEAKIYLPNYREVDQLLRESPESASISFNQVLSKASLNMMRNQEKVYAGIERDSLIADVNIQYQNDEQKFIRSNPSGRGYTQYVTENYNKLIESAASKAQSSEVSQEIRSLGRLNLKGIANSAVQKENQLTTAYFLSEKEKTLEIKYNQIQNDPDRFEGLSSEVAMSLKDMQVVISPKEYQKLQEQTQQNLFMSYGMGLVRKNINQAAEFLKSDLFVKNLSHKNYEKLIGYLEKKQTDNEKRDYRSKMVVLQQEKSDSRLESINVETAIKLGTIGLADIESNDKLTPIDRQKCIKEWHTANKEEVLKNRAYEKMNNIWSNGGDISLLESKYQKMRYQDMVSSKQEQLNGESEITGQEVTVTSVDKALIAANFSYTNMELRDEMQTKILQKDNLEDRINACVALKYLMSTSPRTLGSIDQRYINFANEVVNHVSVNPSNKANIVEIADKKYLSDNKIDNKYVSEKMRKFISSNVSKTDWFINNYNFNGRFWRSITIEDKSQFKSDMYYEISNALFNGASNIGEAQDIAASRLKDYWKEVDGKYVRNPPALMNPTLSSYALKNFIGEGVKKAVSQLNKTNYAGPKFELTNEIVRSPSNSRDWYSKDLTLNKKPMIGIKIGDKIYKKEVELESIAMENGAYKMYCIMDDGTKYYIPSHRNPLLHQILRLGPRNE